MEKPRWLELAEQFDKENLKRIPAELVHDNGIGRVYINKNWVYKRSIPFMIENELYFLQLLNETGYVPGAMRYDKYTIRIEFIKNEAITDPSKFQQQCALLLFWLARAEVRHGDLTDQNVLVRNNKPVVIDWGESRLMSDPRPLKRQEGDAYWIAETMIKLLNRS